MFKVLVTYPDAAALIAGRTKKEIADMIAANPDLTKAQVGKIQTAIVERDARRAGRS